MTFVAKAASETFSAEVVHTEPLALDVVLAGSADFEAKADLTSIVDTLHTEAVARGISRVVVDLRSLEFMNSSCFKLLVSWVAQIQSLDAAQQYKLHFRSEPNHHWQRRSLAALHCFAVELVSIES